MTTAEQKTVNAIGLKQATMEANQVYMANDIQEIKSDIKEIKDMLSKSSDLYVSKKFVRWVIGIGISVAFLTITLYDHLHKAIK